jgi:predicted nucleotidyltransferase
VAKVQNEKGTVMTRADIVRILGTKKQELLEVHGVTQIGLFGSYARQSAGDDSDIDIMVEIEDDKKTLRNFFDLKRNLEKILEKKVDLGISSTLKPLVKETAEKGVIYV